ncbi:MAG TPA: hypothetical protein VGI43_12815 [Mucilaginibacter sp.]
MKKFIQTFLVLLISTLAASAQKLIITEVDAAETNYFNKTSVKILGEKMDLNISGDTLSVEIANEPKLVLTKYSERHFETERKTKNGIEKFSLQLTTINSVISSAELTAAIVPKNDQQEKVWWTVTARNSDQVPTL